MGVIISGVQNLVDLIKLPMNKVFKLDDDEALRLSPVLQVDTITKTCLVVIVAPEKYEAPEILKGNQLLHKQLRDKGLDVTYHGIDDTDHFYIIEDMIKPEFLMTKIILDCFQKPLRSHM